MATAIELLEQQDGMIAPFAHALVRDGRMLFLGKYDADALPSVEAAVAALFARLRALAPLGAAVVFAASEPASGRSLLCINLETLDSAPEGIVVPYIYSRPPFGAATVRTYAPERATGVARIYAADR